MSSHNSFSTKRTILLRRKFIVNLFLLSLFCILAFLAHSLPFFGWDLAFTNWLQSYKSLNGFMWFVSLFGNDFTPYWITALTALILFLSRFRYEACGVVFCVALSALINTLMKRLIARPRPTDEFVSILTQPGGLSFPSGHVTLYVCYFGFLFFLAYKFIPRKSALRIPLLILLLLPIIFVGLSRIYLGAHWLSDIVGAYLWSSGWLTLSISLYQRLKTKTGDRRQEAGSKS